MDIGRDDIGALQLNAANDVGQPENVNISDVLDAITLADPLYGEVDTMARAPARQPTAEIVEQPASKALRFRYECEGRSAGSIPGANSTSESKTYPTLRINDYIGQCTIVASCVTKDEPYRPHPHNLVGRDRCDKGVCTIRATITEENPTVQFRNLGIQCVKKKEVDTALQKRSALRVDPFRTGFDSRTYQSIELNSVRLAFQVFLPDQSGQMRLPLQAIVSDVIHDKKAMGELAIVRASHCSGSMRGGTQMVLLTEKVSRDEVTVMFYDKSGWRAPANVILVHKQVAIVIETPPYRDPNTSDHVQVDYRLQRGTSPATDDDQSKPFPFEYIPEYPVKKRKVLMQVLNSERLSFLPDQIKIEPKSSPPTHQMTSPHHQMTSPHHQMNSPHQQMYSPVSPYGEQQQNWIAPNPMNPFAADMQWPFQQYAPSPSPQGMTLSPMGAGHLPAHSPGLAPLSAMASPGLQGHVSPAGLQHGAGMGHVSPGLHAPMSHVSPGQHAPLGHVSPGQHAPLGHVSPGLHASTMAHGHISPGLQQQQTYQQMGQVAEPVQSMDTGTPSISGLLATDHQLLNINSSELFSLGTMNAQNLSDSLTRLSTSDLQQHFDQY